MARHSKVNGIVIDPSKGNVTVIGSWERLLVVAIGSDTDLPIRFSPHLHAVRSIEQQDDTPEAMLHNRSYQRTSDEAKFGVVLLSYGRDASIGPP